MPRYIRPWKCLNEALADIVKTGVTETDAKQDICSAIADKAIDFRAMVEVEVEDDDGRLAGYRHTSSRTHVHDHWLASRQVKIPTTFKPSDFEWESSRPKHGWYTTFNSSIDDPEPRIGTEPERRRVKLIELSTPTLARALASNAKSAQLDEATPPQDSGSKHFDDVSALKFVREYAQSEKAAGRRPTQEGAVKAAMAAGYIGERERIRESYRREFPVKRGRPAVAK